MNFARRQECNKCGAPKPGDGGFGGGGEHFNWTNVFRDVSQNSIFRTKRENLLFLYLCPPVLLTLWCLQIAEAGVVMAATEAAASVVVEVSVGAIVEAMEEVVEEDSEGATKWVEGWLM